ncbi:MAG TPA: hypothetical protein VFN10_08770 [Thermoanaerobaculia bacterium]|nr:hypothetical protein [Thermoanaerobaculia bacterium]
MRSALIFAIALLAAAAAIAQTPAATDPAPATTNATTDQPVPTPDYSQSHIAQILRTNVEPPEQKSSIEFHAGAVSFRALGTSWRIVYLPILMPLSGSRFGTSREWPDPFALTNTPIATTPRSWRTQREMNAERKRIERVTRIKVTPEQ